MSDCIDAPERGRRETTPEEVSFTIINPEALLRAEVARAVVRLIRAPARQREPLQEQLVTN